MPIDIDKLTSFAIPTVRQTLRPNDIAFYALSIGVGHDALDPRQLAYVDPLSGPEVMPAMVLVMGHPGFWLGNPNSGVDPKAVLHAAQGLEIFGPLPREGEIESRTCVFDVIDKGQGKAALIFSATELFDDAGRMFARLDRTTFIRNGGGFGGRRGREPERAAPPEAPPDVSVDLRTIPEQALLYRLNGDLNPLHSDPEFARKAGFERPILHGLCTMGVVAHALLGALANYRADDLQAMRLRFAKPVYPGETIRTEIWNDGRFRARVVERDTVVIEDGKVEIASRAQDDRSSK